MAPFFFPNSSGGAGIQADLNTSTSNGIFGATIIAALTAQNSVGVQSARAVDDDFLQDQLKSVLSDGDIKTIKTGVLYSSKTIEIVASNLKNINAKLIVDPIMLSTAGSMLLEKDDIDAYIIYIRFLSVIA